MRLLFLFLIFSGFIAQAQVIEIPRRPDNTILLTDASSIAPGSIIELSGNYKAVRIQNLKGTPEKPIIIRNKGRVVISGYSSFACIVSGENFKILGTDVDSMKGIKVAGYGNTYTGFGFGFGESTNVELAGVEMTQLQSGVLMNPKANTNMENCYFHDNYIHNLNNPEANGRSEGFYLGNTSMRTTGRFINCRVENNILDSLAGDGIQVCNGNFIIKGNRISNYAKVSLKDQRNGILVGGAASAIVQNNTVENGGGNCLQMLGWGANVVSGNTFKNTDVSNLTNECIVYINAKSANEENPFSVIFKDNNFQNVKSSRAIIANATKGNNLASVFCQNKGLKKSGFQSFSADQFSEYVEKRKKKK